ncbi:MAG: hypothetical protein EPO09_14425 [Aquabacterium sp.]|uniref:hypothetical protein n=1 Tax=Aquabacterium sp. TaxID=1872578 RepID=UPI00122A79B7|nr:hypothetical protein [Aquabacterium sp.]TAK92868.1 MAG: hypothetical protein EPO09_14425 [Aquabacterium sp.]
MKFVALRHDLVFPDQAFARVFVEVAPPIALSQRNFWLSAHIHLAPFFIGKSMIGLAVAYSGMH